MRCKKLTMFVLEINVHCQKKSRKLPYLSNEKRYRKNSNGFELHENQRQKIVSGVSGL